jgi:endonuclease III
MENNAQNPINLDLGYRREKYHTVAPILEEVYGSLEWQDGQDAMDELVSCILSQNTSDTNRDRGFFALKERYPTWTAVAEAQVDELVDTIRPAGLANQKAPRIQNVLQRIRDERGAYDIEFLRDMPLEDARQWLVDLDGVGPKTAAIVLCFAFNRPAFPVDTHVHRVGQRIGLLPLGITAEKAHPFMEAVVEPEKYYQFHIHLIRHGRDTCKARNPQCHRCPVAAYCDYYQSLEAQPEDT